MEYTYLLTSQLENQRKYFEEKIAALEVSASFLMIFFFEDFTEGPILNYFFQALQDLFWTIFFQGL